MPTGIPLGADTTFSDLVTTNIDKPEYATELFSSYGDQWGKHLMQIKAMGGLTRAFNQTGTHYEEDWYTSTVIVKTTVADQGIDTPISFLIQLSQVDTSTGTARAYPVIGQILSDNSSRFGRITNVTANATDVTVTVQPRGGTSFGEATAGKVYAITTNSWPEASGQPQAQESFWLEYEWQAQIIKTSAAISGTALVTDLKANHSDTLSSFSNYMQVLNKQAFQRQNRAIVGAILTGVPWDDTDQPSTTVGMLETFQNRAIPFDYGAVFAIEDIQNMIDAAKVNNIGNNMMAMLGYRLNRKLNNALQTLTANQNIEGTIAMMSDLMFTGAESNRRSLFTTLAWNGVIVDNVNFAWQTLDLTYDEKLLNTPLSIWPDIGFVFPAESRTTLSGELKKAFDVKYYQEGVENRLMKVWDDGAASPRQIGEVDEWLLYMLSHIAIDWYEIEKCVLLSTSGAS